MESKLSAELMRSALASAPDAMLFVDAAGRVVFANRQMCSLFGYSAQEIATLGVEDLLPEHHRALHRVQRGSFMHEQRTRLMGIGLELLGRRKDGTEFPVEISLSPIHDAQRDLVAAAIRDVTAHRRIQAALLEARQAAERAAQTKSRFLATASHDLRQPLQSLALLNGALMRMVSDTQAQEALHYQDLAIGAMSRLLNALLDVSKLESGAVRPQPADMDIGPLFAELEQEFASLASNKHLTLHIDHGGQCVHCDAALLGQILRNLLSNALKYTCAGRVSLTCARDGAAVRIEVSDTGIGIDPRQLPHIYDEFYQIERADGARREGYGLGLSIVRRLVDLLGIGLEVRSSPGHGTAFTLTVPPGERCAPPRPPPPLTPPLSVHAEERRCILLVEDDSAVRDATGLLLRVEGYTVRPAGSLGEALECIDDGTRIDLVITDYHLGAGETGTEVISQMRARLGETLPAVLITGDTSSAVRALESARLRLASKPIRADELLELLRALLARSDAPSTQSGA
ncbi:MAG: ATP-binding protein [Pseudomonadota bacterium]|jgi:PAS domain S-box-containing protein|nr:ATP-binding protein [Pseudomonadota bacterium]